jgi:hypothetical protein
LENIPISITDDYDGIGHISIEISREFVFYRFPDGVYLDCDEALLNADILNYFALGTDEFLHVIFGVESGTLDQHAKFCSVNSIGISGEDGKVVLNICCQRKSFDLKKIICNFFPKTNERNPKIL